MPLTLRITRLAATDPGTLHGRCMQFLTDFADLAVAAPLALCVAAWLALSGWPRGTLLWLTAFMALMLTMLALKLAVLGCAPADSPLASPSGHTASATFVYGGIAILALRPRLPAAALIGLALAALFGASRVALHVHTLADVIAGGAAGIAALLVFVRVAPPPPTIRPRRMLVLCLAAALVLHGLRLNMEPRLRGAAHFLPWSVCPKARPGALPLAFLSGYANPPPRRPAAGAVFR
jgi:membrane-associated phospholipid phosphatase